MKINLINLNFKIAMLFPITTLFQSIFPLVNKVFFGLLLITFLPLYFNKMTTKRIIVAFFTFLVIIYDYLITKGDLYNLNELFYFPFCILFFTYMSENYKKYKEFLLNERIYIYSVIFVWTFLVFISIFFSSSWIIEWGGARYFGSLCKSVWRLVPTAVFIGTLDIVLIIYYKQPETVYQNKIWEYYKKD